MEPAFERNIELPHNTIFHTIQKGSNEILVTGLGAQGNLQITDIIRFQLNFALTSF